MGKYDDDEDEVKTTLRAVKDRYEEDDEDETPVRRTKVVADDEDEDDAPLSPRLIKRGWGAAENMVSADSSFAQRLKISEDEVIVKFLEDEPYAVFRQHWIERSGQKSFTCIADLDPKGCPLCDAGSRPSSRFNFNVALLTTDGEAVVKSYEVGARVIDQLKNFSVDPRQGPLVKHYWAISRSGKGARSSTNHQMIRDRDLEEYDLQPIDDAAMTSLKKQAYDASIIQIPTRKALLEVAKEDLDD